MEWDIIFRFLSVIITIFPFSGSFQKKQLADRAKIRREIIKEHNNNHHRFYCHNHQNYNFHPPFYFCFRRRCSSHYHPANHHLSWHAARHMFKSVSLLSSQSKILFTTRHRNNLPQFRLTRHLLSHNEFGHFITIRQLSASANCLFYIGRSYVHKWCYL